MRISELLAVGRLRLGLLTGDPDTEFRGVHITDLPDPGRYLSGGELVLTGLMWRHGPADSAPFVAALARAGVAALGAGLARLGHVPGDLVEACAQAGLPLLEVPTEVSFGALAELAAPGPAGEARDALGRHRRLVAAVAEGAGLTELFALTAAELGVTGAVVSACGQVVAGHADDPVGIARAYLTAPALPCRSGAHTLFAVGPGGTGHGRRAAGWVLACDGDLMDRTDLGHELAACVTLERNRMEEGRRVERRLAEQLVTAALTEPDPAVVAARLRTCGIGDGEPYAVVSATLPRRTPDGNAPERGPGPATLGGRALEELLGREVVAAVGAGPAPEATRPHRAAAMTGPEHAAGMTRPEHAAGVTRPERASGVAGPERASGVAGLDGAVAVVPLGGASAGELAERLRRGAEVLAALPDGRLRAGLSGELTGAAALQGGIEEAGHARRLAEARSGGVVTSDEIYTHALLLATVPGDVRRSFAARLLGPLVDYDRRHQSELVRTLATFLDCAGSWNACGERLHVHVNTVRYRIGRVEELTGRDLSSMADRVDLFLALRAG
ncbi:helix-turn-helix domain-containing protein [Nonomuraea rhodomycinica]|uniref:Helix-turn-helix domain-containing protein n=1 Tax=Nonomuraea rhodomycinica TaxID=1712872 RepID=A0A7Y6MAS4_9ACTN|nr:helix-turn-helix domain-containing protein [Nonomuraea rhodomycinica]NUW40130.1 helix-turn-helix domain-containing protein [Nonomuraea rhodomycinica]